MRWHTVSLVPGSITIQNGDIVVGSIKLLDDMRWHVEVLWSGPGGDIKGMFGDYPQAVAFVEGVEKTLMALGLADARMANQIHGERHTT